MPTSSEPRAVNVRVLSPVGWIDGTFLVPPLRSLVEWLEDAGPFLRLLEARLPGATTTLRSFALQRAAAILVVPKGTAELERTREPLTATERHVVSCVMPFGVLHGEIVLAPGVRLGDFLLHHAGFLIVRRCRIQWTGGKEAARVEPLIVVNAAHVVGANDEAERLAVAPAAPRRRWRG